LFLPPFLVGIATVGVLASSKEELARIESRESAIPLEVVRVALTEVAAEVTGFGTAESRRVWTATAEVGGRVTAVHLNLRSGLSVRAGETLVQIDRTDYELRVGQRQAELAQAEAKRQQTQLARQADEKSLAIQKNLLEVRRSEVERLSQLRKRSASSQGEYDAAVSNALQQSQTVQNLESALMTYPTQIAADQAAIDLAKARLAEAQRDVERTVLSAPFDGVLSGVSLEPDQYVAPGQRLFDVLDSDLIEIEAQFSLSQLGRILRLASANQTPLAATDGPSDPLVDGGSMADQWTAFPSQSSLIGTTASIAVRSGDLTMRYPATVIRITEALDAKTRTLGVVVQVDNSRSGAADVRFALRPGAYCEVNLIAEKPTAAHPVPRSSVDADSVYVIDAEHRLRRRPVSVAFAMRDRVAVTSGLSNGELVVVSPPAAAAEGQLVEPIIVERGR
jgi:RND family efflux transporter MFP subunit